MLCLKFIRKMIGALVRFFEFHVCGFLYTVEYDCFESNCNSRVYFIYVIIYNRQWKKGFKETNNERYECHRERYLRWCFILIPYDIDGYFGHLDCHECKLTSTNQFLVYDEELSTSARITFYVSNFMYLFPIRITG